MTEITLIIQITGLTIVGILILWVLLNMGIAVILMRSGPK